MPMSCILSAVFALLGPTILAGLSDYSIIELEQNTRGAFLHKASGYYVFKLEIDGLEHKSCSHRQTKMALSQKYSMKTTSCLYAAVKLRWTQQRGGLYQSFLFAAILLSLHQALNIRSVTSLWFTVLPGA